MRIQDIAAFATVREAGLAKLLPSKPRVAVGMGTCGSGNGAEAVFNAFASEIDARGLAVQLAPVGCFGFCAEEPLVNVWVPGRPLLILHGVQPHDVDAILGSLGHGTMPPEKLILCKIEEWDHLTGHVKYGYGYPEIPAWNEVPFFNGQVKIVLRDCGLINPDDIEEYVAVGGYQALYKVLIDQNPAGVIESIKAAKLRGRGGAGYLTGNKWEFLANAEGPEKYLVCNADEGDPGAYMNRNEIEGDPHALLEGMIIAGYVTGTPRGIVYVRAEYPLAVIRLERAIEQARAYGILGDNVMGRGFAFDIETVEGAGAFVCGEETALIASLEGEAGRPRSRPPFPAQKGLYGKPTNVNNVETWYNVAPIVSRGPAWFTETGSAKSAGTKVFSLVGKVAQHRPRRDAPRHAALHVHLRHRRRRRHRQRDQGRPDGRPLGRLHPGRHARHARRLRDARAARLDHGLGRHGGDGRRQLHGGRRPLLHRVHPLRELREVRPVPRGPGPGPPDAQPVHARRGDPRGHRRARRAVPDGPRHVLCALGNSAPNPVLTSLRHFRHEFEDHIVAKRCRAGVCEDLALSPCENSCPLHMNIPRFLQLYKEGRLEDAFLAVILDNPLPASTGRVCQHPCDHRCRRAGIDEAVNMRDVHRLIADQVLLSDRFEAVVARVRDLRLEATGREVAIVGAGPTGLTCAYYLALLGHSVTVFDSRPAAGGMLRYALPEYRLPKNVLDREIELIERLGVRFQFNVNVGEDLSLNDVAHQFDAVFLAIGTWKEGWVYIPGTELTGVIPALPFLEAVSREQEVPVGKSVVVIGGGNAAIDSARTARRLGADVTVVYRRERKDMPAIPEEIEAAEHEGVKVRYLAAPHRIIGDKGGAVVALEAALTKLGEFDTSGRRRRSSPTR